MTKTTKLLAAQRARRAKRTRAKLLGTAERPRLSVYRSARQISVQAIDDEAGRTLFAVSSLAVKPSKGTKKERAAEVGRLAAEKARELKIAKLIFDRGRYAYHGRVKEVAEALRAAGIAV